MARAAAEIGFRKIRLTGGEPTLRPDLIDIVRAVTASGVPDIALTTNGIRLPELAPALVDAGLRRVNVHLDTLDPARLARIMRGALASNANCYHSSLRYGTSRCARIPIHMDAATIIATAASQRGASGSASSDARR